MATCDTCGNELKRHEMNRELWIYVEGGYVNSCHVYHRCDKCNKGNPHDKLQHDFGIKRAKPLIEKGSSRNKW